MRSFIITALLVAISNLSIGQTERESIRNYLEEDIFFINSKDTIYGKLILPRKTPGKFPVVVFIHGSGPEDYSSSNLYRPLWEKFTKAGFACFSWDKPGIGLSQGNWFEQSIGDRASEVIAAHRRLQQHPKIDPTAIGLWGISQAGWVIPKVAEEINPAFIITVSGPVTTAFDQEVYRLGSEMAADGFSRDAIDSAIAYTREIKGLILTNSPFSCFDALQKDIKPHAWSSHVISGDEAIYKYLGVIMAHDHIPNLSSLTCPVLAIWGENDLLVPPGASAQAYTQTMEQIGNKHAKMVIVPNADHTLTYNKTGRREETMERREKYKDKPEEIFAPGYLKLMSKWLKSLEF